MTIAPWRTGEQTRRSSRRRALAPQELLGVAEGLARTAGDWPGLRDPVKRTWRTVAATDRYEAFVIAWPVGGSIELHDHGDSAGAVVVVAGAWWRRRWPTMSPAADGGARRSAQHDHLEFGPGHVHDLANLGPGPALSVHVYSPVLRSMTFFEPRDGPVLVAVRHRGLPRPGRLR